jgi:hypothetical protein
MRDHILREKAFLPWLSLLPGPLMRVVSPLQQGAVAHGPQARFTFRLWLVCWNLAI